MLSQKQIQELLQLVEDYHLSFVAQNIGTDILSEKDINRLLKAGFTKELLHHAATDMDYAFKFGIISEVIGKAAAQKMTFDGLKKYINSGQFIPLTQYEKDVLTAVKNQSYKDIKGLGNRIVDGIKNIFNKENKQKRIKYEKIIQEEAIKTIQNRETIKDFVSRLGEKTKDWNRDLGRICDYVMHKAFDEGRAISILRKSGKDAEVYKDVYTGACDKCQELYLTNGLLSQPKVFKLKELIANRDNIGVSKDKWKPVLGPTHPFCRCTTHETPLGFEFDEKTGGYTKEDKNWTRKIERQSKIKIKIGKEEKLI